VRKRLTFRESKRPNEETPNTQSNQGDREHLRPQISPLQDNNFNVKLNSFKAIDSVDSVNNLLNKTDTKRAPNKHDRNIHEEENDNDYSIHHTSHDNSIKSSMSSSGQTHLTGLKTNAKSVTSIIRHPLPHEILPSTINETADQILSTQAIQIHFHSPSKLNSYDTSSYVIENSDGVAREKEKKVNSASIKNIQYQDNLQHNSHGFNGK